jgi:hypothetical protein
MRACAARCEAPCEARRAQSVGSSRAVAALPASCPTCPTVLQLCVQEADWRVARSGSPQLPRPRRAQAAARAQRLALAGAAAATAEQRKRGGSAQCGDARPTVGAAAEAWCGTESGSGGFGRRRSRTVRH